MVGEITFFKSHSNYILKKKFVFYRIYNNLLSLGFGFINITYLLSVKVIILHKSGDIEMNPLQAQLEKLN